MDDSDFQATAGSDFIKPHLNSIPQSLRPSACIDLKLFIQSRCTEVFYQCNPGNAGDSIIQAGTFHFFESQNIPYRIIEPGTSIPPETILWYSGGGNLVEYYNDCKKWLMSFSETNPCIILPHTINDIVFLRQLNSRTILICREEKSFELCLANFSGKVFLHQDMAFYLDIARLNVIPKKGRGSLYAFRQDKEKNGQNFSNTLDVSWLFGYQLTNRESIMDCASHFLDVINSFEFIHTDRLHIAIGAFLLGKKHIYLYPNSYYKNRAVYDHSLSSTSVIFRTFA